MEILPKKSNSKLTIQEMKKIAESRGGKCLSSVYTNDHTHLLWECSKGHQWKATPNNVKTAFSWCPICYHERKRKHSLEEMCEIAKSKGGKCISKKYESIKKYLEFECSEGHRWKAKPSYLLHGHWCRKCADEKQRIGIEKMHEIAKQRKGKCLSKIYINNYTPLKWICSKKHQWKASADRIIPGSWCPICARKKRGEESRKYSIEIIRKIAEERGGKCLSTTYHWQNRLIWQCANGHRWKSPIGRIIRGSWCPYCCHSRRYNEEKCRYILEFFTKNKFPTNYTILRKRLTLDGYCEKLNLAFEYNGEQHYKFVSRFQKNHKDLKKRKQLDRKKRKICKSKKIKLIIIPYSVSKKGNEAEFILDKLNKFKIEVKRKREDFSYKNFYRSKSKLEEIKELVETKGGKLMSNSYNNAHAHLKIKCHCGYKWITSWNTMKNGSWCPKCAGVIKSKLIDLKEFAKKKGGKCLMKAYRNNYTPMKWMCSNGHIWSARWTSIKHKNTWCPICIREKIEKNQREIIRLRKLGLSYAQIAKQVGCAESTSYTTCRKHLKNQALKINLSFSKW